jgi:CDP-paratose 2-epimerase
MAAKVALVTGSSGLVGSETAIYLANNGWTVHGVDNNMRADFFGPGGDTTPNLGRVRDSAPGFVHHDVDLRNRARILELVGETRPELIVHAAAQPSHDLAASRPFDDFDVNAVGTLNLLEAARRECAESPFVFLSTNKVYGDVPNEIALVELETRWDYADEEFRNGISEDLRIDRTLHSLFGASKAAADLLVQEYGRYFDMPTVCFRGGCLTGPSHAGAKLHGFLSYLMRCAVTGEPYTVFGYDGKQVRDNIHSNDVVTAMEAFQRAPRAGAVYNLGGGRESNCSMREAIAACERISGNRMNWTLSGDARMGDHRWWISDLSGFKRDYPDWRLQYDLETTLREIHDANVERWMAVAP